MRWYWVFLLLLLGGCGRSCISTVEYVQLEKDLQHAELELDRIRSTPVDTVHTIEIKYLPQDTFFVSDTTKKEVGTGLTWESVMRHTIDIPYGVVGVVSHNYYSRGKFSQFLRMDPLTTFLKDTSTIIDGSVEVSSAEDKRYIKELEAENRIYKENQETVWESLLNGLIGLVVLIIIGVGIFKFLPSRKG